MKSHIGKARPSRMLPLAFVVLLIVTACTSQAPASTTPAPTTDATVRVAMGSFAQESTAKWMGTLVMLAYIGPMYDPLIAPGRDGKLTKNGIISDWKFNDTGDVLTLSVRPGVRFHTGDEVTAEDIKFTLETFTRPGLPVTAGGALRAAIKGVTVKDQYNVEVSLNNPDGTFLFYLSWLEGDVAVISKRYFDALPGATFEEKTAEFVKKPNGTGPFKFVTREVGRSIEFEANLEYFDKSRIPKIRKLVLLQVVDPSTRMNMLRTNEAEIIEAEAEQAVEAQRNGFQAYLAKNVVHGMIGFLRSYDTSFVTNDLRVRKALTLAVDRSGIVKALFPEIPGVGATGELARGSAGTGPGVAGYRQDFQSYPYDPDQAKRLLEESGYTRDPRTVVAWSYTSSGFAVAPKVLEAVADYWKTIGVRVEIRASEQQAVIAKLLADPQQIDSNDVAVFNAAWRPSGANNLRTLAMSKSLGGVIRISSTPQKVDDLVRNVVRVTDLQKYDEEMARIWRTLYDDYWAIPIVWVNKAWAANKNAIASYVPLDFSSDYSPWETVTARGR